MATLHIHNTYPSLFASSLRYDVFVLILYRMQCWISPREGEGERCSNRVWDRCIPIIMNNLDNYKFIAAIRDVVLTTHDLCTRWMVFYFLVSGSEVSSC